MKKGILIGFALCLVLFGSTGAKVEEAPAPIYPHPDSEVVVYVHDEIFRFKVWYDAMGPDVPCGSMAAEALATLERITNETMNSARYHPVPGYSITFLGNAPNCTQCECPPPPEEEYKK